MEVFQDWLVVSIRKNAVVQRRVTNLKNGKQYAIQFPETYYAVFPGDNPTFNSNKLRLTYSSPVTPTTVYDYDLSKRSFIRLKRQVVKGYDRSQYETKLVWVSARDGARIPVSLTYRKGRAKQGPMLLDAYGAYGAPSFPFFSSNDVSLWNRGMATGIAAIRGGGDMGDAWHEQGKMARKINTFTDFIDCAQALVSMGYTKHDRLAITGGSAGGLTMGAVMNLRPSVARVALVYVPFVDVINTMLDESLPLTTQEFLEWGNPKNSIHYWWLRQYSPYENIGHYDYPAVLVRTSLNDSQVPYWEAAKWVARLRDRRADKDPLLLKTNLDAGHGGSSGRYDALRDSAHDYAFMLNVLGIRD
jgi:oligopeptidase B